MASESDIRFFIREPPFFLWILCLFVASKTLTRKQTPGRLLLATKTHKTHKKEEQNGTKLVVTDTLRSGQPLSFFLGRDAVVHADFVAQAHHADCVFERDVAVASNQD